MKDQLKTIREFIESVHEGEWAPYAGRYEALTALSELERMAGEPVSHATVAGALFDFMGWLTSRRARLVLSSVDNAAPAADAIKEFAAMRGLSINDAQVQTWKEQLAIPPAQQPQKLEDIEQYRMQMAGISTAATGYWKEGDSIHPDYDTPALRDVAKLYAKYDALYKAQQPQYEAGDMASAHNDGFRAGVASVAQQPQARPDFTDEWTGYLKDGETPFERFLRERKDLNALTKLYQRALEENERIKAHQPQAEAVQACGHPMSLLLRSAESNEPLYCEACDDKSGRHDAERRETELLDANRHLQEKIASADALKLHAIEELCQLGYTVKEGELIPPDHLHKLVEAANHPLCGKQTEAVPPTRADLDRAYSAGLVEGERLAIQQAEAVPQDVGQLEYRGNSVAFIHQKMTAYRGAIDAAWQAVRDAGHHPDGYTPLAQAITKALSPAQAEAVPNDVVRDAELFRLAVRKGLLTIHSEHIATHDPASRCSWMEGHDKACDISNDAAMAQGEKP